jgi:hypothetical protein
MPLTILWDARAWAPLHIHLVALDDQYRAGVLGEDPRGQQAGNAAAQYAHRVQQNRSALGKIHPRQFLEHFNRRLGHDDSVHS